MQDPPAIDLGRPFREARDAFERRYLAAALERTQGNVAAAARASGLDRLTFYRLLWRRGLRFRTKTRLPGRPDIVFPTERIAG